ncbi:MAG: LysR family transcriptional regulator [Terriglobia bacterium]
MTRIIEARPAAASQKHEALTREVDLKEIRYFVAAYEEGSFSKAAEREHCTQPGLSVYIQRLEAVLAQRLFDRKARGVTPTIAGRHFYACCTDILKSVRTAKQRMLDMSGRLVTEINLGLPPTLLKGVVPRMLPGYLANHPYVDVRIAEAYSGTLTDWVISGEVEVAIVTNPPAHLELETTYFFRDQLVLVTSPNSGDRKRGRRQQQRSSDLEKLKLILPSQRHGLRKVIESAVRVGTSGSPRILEIDGMLGTLEVVRNSDWATLVASIAVADEVKQGRLVAEALSGPRRWLDFYLIRTKDRVLSPACRDFLAQVKETINRLADQQKFAS